MSEVVTEKDRLIRRMPEVLANKIAAGEVVQRPSSVVKELIENSIDSGATRIDVAIKVAGTELIQVSDNGCGMNSMDALACFERHATSKISAIDDLNRIRTLGFRGEALASIAAVSRVLLKTGRSDDDTGTLIQIEGGTVVRHEPCAVAQGSTFSIRSLFYNVPARRNFLKTDATEYRHIVDTFLMLAVSNPSVAFSLSHNDISIFKLTTSASDLVQDSLRQRLVGIYDDAHGKDLVWIDESTGYLGVRGFVSLPSRHKRSRGDQYLFVNGRSIKSRYLEHAIRVAYQDYLPDGTHPMFALFLSMDPAHVDVNVHPTKAEVKFDDERGIYAMIRAITARSLAGSFSIPNVSDRTNQNDPLKSIDLGSFSYQNDRQSDLSRDGRQAVLTEQLYVPSQQVSDSTPEFFRDTATLDRGEPTRDLLFQLAFRYIVVHMRSGLILVDQQRAHERVIYERALSNLNGSVAMSQQLLFPVTVEMQPGKYDSIVECLSDLRLLGFDIQKFGGNSLVVRGVPSEMREGEIPEILEDIVDSRSTRSSVSTPQKEHLAKTLARRTSVKSGARMSDHEMKILVDQLFVCEAPYVSPSGKPVVVWMTTDEIDKRFDQMSR